MKAKLLRKIRKDHTFKFKDGKWRVLSWGRCREYDNLELALTQVLYTNLVHYDEIFISSWLRIYYNYIEKLEIRKFNR
jgi:hypothetical protein